MAGVVRIIQPSGALLFDEPFSLVFEGFHESTLFLRLHCVDASGNRSFQYETTLEASHGHRLDDGALALMQLVPEKGISCGQRFQPSLEKPVVVHVEVNKRHCASFERYFLSPDYRREPVDHLCPSGRRIFGSFFSPPEGCNDVSPLLEVGGSAGGLLEWRTALICSRLRCPAFCLAWFRFGPILPPTMQVEVEYMLDAISFLQQKVHSSLGINIYAVSKGTELTFLAASKTAPNVISRIAVNGPQAFVTEPSFFFQKKLITPFCRLELERTCVDRDDPHCVDMLPCFDFDHSSPHVQSSALPVSNLHPNIRIMFLCGSDDGSLPALKNALFLADKMSGRNVVSVHSYPGAGHLLEPPSPHCSYCVSAAVGGQVVRYGGNDVAAHARAKKMAFVELLRFFTAPVETSTTKTKAKL